jgi:hypothetical protein
VNVTVTESKNVTMTESENVTMTESENVTMTESENVTMTESENVTSGGNSRDLLQSALDSAENFSDYLDPEIQTDPENESDPRNRFDSDHSTLHENGNSKLSSESMETTAEEKIDFKG